MLWEAWSYRWQQPALRIEEREGSGHRDARSSQDCICMEGTCYGLWVYDEDESVRGCTYIEYLTPGWTLCYIDAWDGAISIVHRCLGALHRPEGAGGLPPQPTLSDAVLSQGYAWRPQVTKSPKNGLFSTSWSAASTIAL